MGDHYHHRHHTRPSNEEYETNPIPHNRQGINGLQGRSARLGAVPETCGRFVYVFPRFSSSHDDQRSPLRAGGPRRNLLAPKSATFRNRFCETTDLS